MSKIISTLKLFNDHLIYIHDTVLYTHLGQLLQQEAQIQYYIAILMIHDYNYRLMLVRASNLGILVSSQCTHMDREKLSRSTSILLYKSANKI
jgi:hypothetical protein